MGFAMRHHGESRTETGNGSALSSITETDMDPKKTTLAELIDAFVAADRPAPLGASALSRLAYWHGALGTHAVAAITPDDVDAALAQLIARGLGAWTSYSARAGTSCCVWWRCTGREGRGCCGRWRTRSTRLWANDARVNGWLMPVLRPREAGRGESSRAVP